MGVIMETMETMMNLHSISIILVRPKFHENIGSVARAMQNMGIHRLGIVAGCSPLHMNAYKLASGAEAILERAEEYGTLQEALSEIGCVVGTTSREGKERTPLLSPRDLASQMLPISSNNSIALVFGSEREGLTNDELSLCHLFVRIPSSEGFPSLNLSQAVMLLCYEMFLCSGEAQGRASVLARSEQVERMFGHMEKTLVRVGFLDPKHPERIMRSLRRMFGRSQLEERDVRILQGIWSQVDWHAEQKGKRPSPEEEGLDP
jgi:tRNA/rRNA methyltransferase